MKVSSIGPFRDAHGPVTVRLRPIRDLRDPRRARCYAAQVAALLHPRPVSGEKQ